MNYLLSVHLGYFIGVIETRRLCAERNEEVAGGGGGYRVGGATSTSTSASNSASGVSSSRQLFDSGEITLYQHRSDSNCGIYFGKDEEESISYSNNATNTTNTHNNNDNNNNNNNNSNYRNHNHDNNRGAVDDKTQEDFNAMISLMLISFSLGFRFLFMAMPFVFYAAGPISLVITATVMICFLVFIDHPHSLLGCLSVT